MRWKMEGEKWAEEAFQCKLVLYSLAQNSMFLQVWYRIGQTEWGSIFSFQAYKNDAFNYFGIYTML